MAGMKAITAAIDAKATTLQRACTLSTSGKINAATEVIGEQYPFVSFRKTGRRYTPHQLTSIFVRDGFIVLRALLMA
jgi:hypothetical protein